MSISVSTLVKYLKNKLDSDDSLQSIQVTGELSNFHKHSSGHLYFTLKDEKAAISCVMFSSYAKTIKFNPKNGDKVEITASASIFEVTGQLQLYVNSLKLAGLGDLYQQYEMLKNKLASEGYFNEDHKKEFNVLYPNKVAILVGEASAAMSDIKTCFQRRWPLCQTDYYPCLVQGKDAPIDIISKLVDVDGKNYDYIILARGGGSFEDLFCFNDEELVKTIYNLKTFIITGIGHEQDFTLADFVSDLRAPTPTATVELTTPNILDVKEELIDIMNNIDSIMENRINNISINLDYFITKINNYSTKLELINSNIDSYVNQMKSIIKHLIDRRSDSINSLNNLLNAYSVNNTLKRGYTLVFKDNILIKNTKNLKLNDDINIKLYDGNAKAIIKEVKHG